MTSAGGNGLVLVVRGVKGFLDGEERRLAVGEELVVGRSRRADLSTRLAKRLYDREDRMQILRSPSFLSVSRRHVEIRFLRPGLVEVKDVSANGTYLDGARIDCAAVTDLRQRKRVLRLASQERLELSIEERAPEDG